MPLAHVFHRTGGSITHASISPWTVRNAAGQQTPAPAVSASAGADMCEQYQLADTENRLSYRAAGCTHESSLESETDHVAVYPAERTS